MEDVYICSVVSSYTSLCKYFNLLDNDPRGPKHVGD